MPILPMVLVNGGHGIGTGWSTDVPSYNPRDIVDNLKRLMEHEVMWMIVCVWVGGYIHACMHAYMHIHALRTHTQTYMHICIYRYGHVMIMADQDLHIHALHTHTNTHTSITQERVRAPRMCMCIHTHNISTREQVMEPMHPWYRGFKGQIELNVSKKGDVSYCISGLLGKVNDTTIQVSELPVGKWTQQYKEFLESLLETDGGKKEPFIKGYKEFHTDTTVHFEISMTEKSMREAEEVGLYKKFQLQRNLSISNMHLFNAQGQIVKYDNPEQIMREFYELRLEHYAKRKDYMVGELERQLSVLDNKCRFIKEVIAGTLKLNNRKKADIVEDLKKKGYAPMVKEAKKKGAGDADEDGAAEDEHKAPGITAYDYLLNMPLMSLTLERVNTLQVHTLQAERDNVYLCM